jgi:hypothetical protein
VIKLDAEGTPLWTIPIVGDELEHDYATDITLDSANNVWITGWTSSDDFPTTPDAIYPTHIHFRDAFVMKMDSEDGTILYSTYLGGDYTDQGQSIFLNDSGEVYVVGSTGSTDFPTTPDAYQGKPSAPLYIYTDAFITKLSADGSTILYSTYFGGYKDDEAENVALDEAGNIVFAGQTNAVDFPLVNPIQTDPNNMFVSKLSADGSTLQFSTYFGGEDIDGLGGMVLDSEDFVYITGSTRSIYFPTTLGAFQEDFVGEILGCEESFPPVPYNCEDVFVTKLATDGSGIVYSTYLGGSEIEHGRNIAIDSQGRAYVVGYTNSPDFPPNGIDFSAEIFVSKFDPSGSELDYSFTVDSGSAGAGHGVNVDNAGGVYFTGAFNVPADIYIAKITSGPDVTVSIFSSMTQVPRNSNFLFDVQLTNNEMTPQTLRGWTAGQKLTNGLILQPLIGPVMTILQPGETKIYSNITQYVGNIPLATYRYYVRIGEDFPEPLWDEDYWDIEVIP